MIKLKFPFNIKKIYICIGFHCYYLSLILLNVVRSVPLNKLIWYSVKFPRSFQACKCHLWNYIGNSYLTRWHSKKYTSSIWSWEYKDTDIRLNNMISSFFIINCFMGIYYIHSKLHSYVWVIITTSVEFVLSWIIAFIWISVCVCYLNSFQILLGNV